MKKKLLSGVALAVFASLALTACASGGGGSGGSNPEKQNPPPKEEPPPPPPPPPAPEDTQEYSAQPALKLVGAEAAWAAGATGEGQIVGVVDTGVDGRHVDLDGQLAEAPGLAAGPGDSATLDEQGHGTMIAGMIAGKFDPDALNGDTMMGIAYDAKIMPLKITDAAGDFDIGEGYAANVRAAWEHGVNNGVTVFNNSYGSNYSIMGEEVPNDEWAMPWTREEIERDYGDLLTGARAVSEVDGVLVWAAGNEGLADPVMEAGLPHLFPELEENWVAVVAVDEEGKTIAGFSNHCGVASDWCLAAPGEWILGPDSRSGIDGDLGLDENGNKASWTFGDGTSFAAPFVSGALALLMDMFPELSAVEAREILLETADNLGPEEIYGHGMVNLERAVNPIGEPKLAMGSSVDGKKVSLSGTRAIPGGAFGDGMSMALAGHKIVALDAYNRGFAIDMANFVSRASVRNLDVRNKFMSFANSHGYEVAVGEAGLSWRFAAGDNFRPMSNAMRLTTGGGSYVEAGFNDRPGNYFTSSDVRQQRWVEERGLNNAHLSLAGEAFTAGFGQAQGASDWQIMGFSGKTTDGLGRTLDNNAHTHGLAVGYTHGMGPLAANISGGAMFEEGSFLGTEVDGAFANNLRTNTTFASLGLEFDAGHGLSFFGQGALGLSNASTDGDSLMTGADGVMTSSFAVGATQRGLLMANDTFGLAMSQPLRVESGKASFDVAGGRGPNGSIQRTKFSSSIEPTGRQMDLQASYATRLDEYTSLRFGMVHSLQPGHNRRADPETLGMMHLNITLPPY